MISLISCMDSGDNIIDPNNAISASLFCGGILKFVFSIIVRIVSHIAYAKKAVVGDNRGTSCGLHNGAIRISIRLVEDSFWPYFLACRGICDFDMMCG